jgi:hypothetical protein
MKVNTDTRMKRNSFRRTRNRVRLHRNNIHRQRLKAQEQDPAARELSFLERLGLLVDQQWNWREKAFGRRLRNAKFRTNACVEEIDYRGGHGLNKSVIRVLVQESSWVETHEMCSCSDRPALARASWPVPWPKKPAVTGTRRSTPRLYSVIWR